MAAWNLRLTSGYAFSHVDSTRADFSNGVTTSTLRIRETDAQQVRVELAGTLPLTHATGARAKLRGAWGGMRQNLDLFDPGNEDFDAASYGGSLETFLRDPELGSLTLAGSLAHRDGNQGKQALEAGGSVRAAIFFPHMQVGAVDWTFEAGYAHREVEDAPNVFLVSARGGAAWYPSHDLRIEVGGGWVRADNERIVEEDRMGHLELRWRLPLPISVELSLSGAAGVSEFKEPPFDGEERFAYGAGGALTFRVHSGESLLETIRAYD